MGGFVDLQDRERAHRLVKDKDPEGTLYRFQLANGETVEVKGNEEIEYDGEMHSAANLYDALKEGYYGKF